MELEAVNERLNLPANSKQINLCVGKEWHRFPNSFFLPHKWNIQFIESEFRGQLPKPFENGPLATRVIPRNMNDENREETSRYIGVDECQFLIDSDYPESSERDKPYSKDLNSWEIVTSHPFLDSARSPPLYRAFYIPYLSDVKCSYVAYNLLKKRNFVSNSQPSRKSDPKKF